MKRTVPTRAEVLAYLEDRSNWTRWGPDNQSGTISLITPAKRAAAAGLVRSGRAVSLARPFPKVPGPGNPHPGQHFVQWFEQGGQGAVVDYYGIAYHGAITTHLDALCHIWDGEHFWGGREPDQVLTTQGVRWGDVDQWREGIITRGVLLDVPRFRGEPFVTLEKPVQGWELEDIAQAQGITIEPGDALIVYSGREAYHRAGNPSYLAPRPGLHASCLPFLRETDVSLLVWDMMDANPNDYDLPWTVHSAIYTYGLPLLDNALLEPLAEVCQAEGRYEFMLTVAPLRVIGGTGSPVNPIALF